jgi:hypothetical protein
MAYTFVIHAHKSSHVREGISAQKKHKQLFCEVVTEQLVSWNESHFVISLARSMQEKLLHSNVI